MIDVLVLVVVVAASLVAALRWLRVAQREHYVAGRTTRIASVWLSRSVPDLVFAVAAVALALAALVPALAVLGASAAVLGAVVPLGLGVRGRTSRLGWTGRLRRLAVCWLLIVAILGVGLYLVAGPGATGLIAVTVPLTIDAALAVMEVVERRLSAPFVTAAQRRLTRVRPQVVAITGSYGKTTTKGYVAHLLAGSRAVVASPASFNNRLGLSRAVNDHLADGTEVFVAEMGTFGPGEIRELCRLFRPDVAVITTIGEAHLERMRSRETILAAKSEITEQASVVVLPIDDPDLAALAERRAAQGARVIRCSVVEQAGDSPADRADVLVDLVAGTVRVADQEVPVGSGVAHGVNLAVAVGVAVALDVEPAALARRLDALPRAAHRAEVHDGPGVAVIDDTYNANPVGARAALAEATAIAERRGGRLVVVSPGIVELGPVQRERNAEFARAVADAGAHLVVVGRTNRPALVDGAHSAGGTTDVVERREQAVELATRLAGQDGVVLYENDLPDHYP